MTTVLSELHKYREGHCAFDNLHFVSVIPCSAPKPTGSPFNKKPDCTRELYFSAIAYFKTSCYVETIKLFFRRYVDLCSGTCSSKYMICLSQITYSAAKRTTTLIWRPCIALMRTFTFHCAAQNLCNKV